MKYIMGQLGGVMSKRKRALAWEGKRRGTGDWKACKTAHESCLSKSGKFPKALASTLPKREAIVSSSCLFKLEANLCATYLTHAMGLVSLCVRHPQPPGLSHPRGNLQPAQWGRHRGWKIPLIYKGHVMAEMYFSSQNCRKMTSLIVGRVLAFLSTEKWEVLCTKQFYFLFLRNEWVP